MADIAHAAIQTEIDGIIATNTTIDKSALGHHPLAGEQGGLSGAPVREASNRVLKQLLAELEGKLPVIGVGGIPAAPMPPPSCTWEPPPWQVYSGLIYRGPALVKECLRACADA